MTKLTIGVDKIMAEELSAAYVRQNDAWRALKTNKDKEKVQALSALVVEADYEVWSLERAEKIKPTEVKKNKGLSRAQNRRKSREKRLAWLLDDYCEECYDLSRLCVSCAEVFIRWTDRVPRSSGKEYV